MHLISLYYLKEYSLLFPFCFSPFVFFSHISSQLPSVSLLSLWQHLIALELFVNQIGDCQ